MVLEERHQFVELDGHYFFYPLYYDLVADTVEEKERVREVVRDLTDHLVSTGLIWSILTALPRDGASTGPIPQL